ncbi:MAG TPA: four helix bundle protein [Chthoniobacterales bacterium]
MRPIFDHENLIAYQESLAFCAWVGDLLETFTGKASVRDQIDRASTSMVLNIAEGNAKFSKRDRVRFLEMASGSTLECAACLDVMVARQLVDPRIVVEAKQQLLRVHNLVMGLIRKFSGNDSNLRTDGVVKDESPDYHVNAPTSAMTAEAEESGRLKDYD